MKANCLPVDLPYQTRDKELEISHTEGSSIDSGGEILNVDSTSGVTLSNVEVRQFITGDMRWLELEQLKRCSVYINIQQYSIFAKCCW